MTTRSLAEVKYRALATVSSEILWMYALLKNLQVLVPLPVLVFYDSSSAIAIASNRVYHARIKHIELDCYFFSMFPQGSS